MNLDSEQSKHVVAFSPGIAAAFADGMDRPLRIRVPYGGQRDHAPDPSQLAEPPIARRRSSACGVTCAGERACTLLELRSADLLADSPDFAWLRVWTEALVLAFLTNSALPVVPSALRHRWSQMDERLRECVLATLVESAVRGAFGSGQAALRSSRSGGRRRGDRPGDLERRQGSRNPAGPALGHPATAVAARTRTSPAIVRSLDRPIRARAPARIRAQRNRRRAGDQGRAADQRVAPASAVNGARSQSDARPGRRCSVPTISAVSRPTWPRWP